MGNKKIRAYYQDMADTIQNPLETRNKAPNFSKFDIAYMQEFINPEHSLLDLGAGSGLLLNHIKDGFQKVAAVELYPEFSKFITPSENTTIVNADLLTFDTDDQFEIVILFGVMNFFSADEAASLYQKFYRFTRPGGKLIVKNQMGVSENVYVDHFSEELGKHYFSEYRSSASESSLMTSAGFIVSRVDDVYPDEFNRWPNTRFTAIVCHKPS
jgi:cyclopropane fatty-acyl-phospholipid synthase-like methyltransferase